MSPKPFSPYSFGMLVLGLGIFLLGAFVAVRWVFPDLYPWAVIGGFVALFLALDRLRSWGAARGYASCPACGHQANHPGRAGEYVSPVKYRPQRWCNNCAHDLTERLIVED